MRSKHLVRGVSLVEAMVAVAVMAFGMLAVVGVQATLRLNGDVAKQRSEATRIAQETLEAARAFAVVDSTPNLQAWADITSSGPTDVAGPVTNATFQVESSVVTYADPPAKAMRVTVHWFDRAGQRQEVVLSSAIAAAAPALSGTLAVRPGNAAVAPVRRPFKRHPSIPPQAREMGSSSVMVPPGHPTLLLVFNNVTGVVTGVCNTNYNTETANISTVELDWCNNTVIGQLVSGFVRFQRATTGPDLTAADVEDPIGPALNVRVNLTLTSTGHPTGSFCIDDTNATTLADGTQRLTTYFCVVLSNSSGLWSGTTTIEPRLDSFVISDDESTGAGADSRYRICRYTPASSDAQPVPNADHPRSYTDVAGNLTNQNFVVISSRKHCPTDVTANPSAGDFINTNTLQHQPEPI